MVQARTMTQVRLSSNSVRPSLVLVIPSHSLRYSKSLVEKTWNAGREISTCHGACALLCDLRQMLSHVSSVRQVETGFLPM